MNNSNNKNRYKDEMAVDFVDLTPFDNSRDDYVYSRLVTRKQVERFVGLASGYIGVLVCEGRWPIEEVAVGRLKKMRVGDVLRKFSPQEKVA